ncbi:MAG TPA: group 1 truncated hemoglobin [Solirubrobacteraceae bacterium]|jgi:hemoglobin|nr:group 1 truncated hemoglobin [Solirubrobacteraceae bacterium]
MPITPVSSLYEQVGGEAGVEAIVDRFYEKLWAEPKLDKFFAGIDRPELKRHQRMFLNLLLGGGEMYTGRPLVESHATLGIDDASYDLVCAYLVETFRDLDIDETIISIAGGALAGFRSSVVTV